MNRLKQISLTLIAITITLQNTYAGCYVNKSYKCQLAVTTTYQGSCIPATLGRTKGNGFANYAGNAVNSAAGFDTIGWANGTCSYLQTDQDCSLAWGSPYLVSDPLLYSYVTGTACTGTAGGGSNGTE